VLHKEGSALRFIVAYSLRFAWRDPFLGIFPQEDTAVAVSPTLR